MKRSWRIGKLCVIIVSVAFMILAIGASMVVSASGNDNPTIYIEDANTLPGKEVTVEIKLVNNLGTAAILFDLEYDDSLLTLNGI